MNKTFFLLSFVLIFPLASCGDNTVLSSFINGTISAGANSVNNGTDGGGNGYDNGNGDSNSGSGITSPYLFGDLRGMNDYEKEIIIEINKVRSDPEGWMISHKVNSGEAWQDRNDNIHTMRGRAPVRQLEVMYGMTRASQEQGSSGIYAHTFDYLEWHVRIMGLAAQNMANLPGVANTGKTHLRNAGYSNPTDAEGLVYAYIRDDGAQNTERPHRENIMDPAFSYIGTGTRGYNVMNFIAAGIDNFRP